jgi:hypothetical protein
MRIERKERRYPLPALPAPMEDVVRESPPRAAEAGFYATGWYAAAALFL